MYTYSYVPIAYDPTAKCRLSFDIKLTQLEYASYFNLGLWDSDMSTQGPDYWHVRYHHTDPGNSAHIFYYNDQAYVGGGNAPDRAFDLGVWYHNETFYDPIAGTLDFVVTRRDDGFLIGTQSLLVLGDFENIERLGISCTLSSYGDRLQAGSIDNVTLSEWQVVPVPGAVLLGVLGLGFSGLLGRRKAFRA
jgi:hypothetical protein